ncbi:MAG: hypothetical protein ACKVX7_11080 [Planctomycetota bacterium]
MSRLLLAVFFLVVTVMTSPVGAQTTTYEVNSGGLSQGCLPPCLCPIVFLGEVSGSFDLEFTGVDGTYDTYNLINVQLVVTAGGMASDLTGTGTYRVDIAAGVHAMTMEIVYFGATTLVETFGDQPIDPAFPFPQILIGLASAQMCFATMLSFDAAPLFVPAQQFVRGDCNADGAMNIADAVTILDVLFVSGSADCANACDGNDDELFNIADAIFLLNNLFGSGASPAPPFPDCGVDPTAGSLACDTFSPCP